MIRTALTEELSTEYGPQWYADPQLFKNPDAHVNYMVSWLNGFRRQDRELFVRHFANKYGKGQLPPSWMLLETVTLGGLSHTFKNLAHSPAKEKIAKRFGHSSVVIAESWFHTASQLRNIVCHHGRIWGAEFGIKPKLSGEVTDYTGSSPITGNRLFSAQLYVLLRLFDAADPQGAADWLPLLKNPLPKLPDADNLINGFKPGWASHPLFSASAEPGASAFGSWGTESASP